MGQTKWALRVKSAIPKLIAGLSTTTGTSLIALREPPLKNLVRAKNAKTSEPSGKQTGPKVTKKNVSDPVKRQYSRLRRAVVRHHPLKSKSESTGSDTRDRWDVLTKVSPSFTYHCPYTGRTTDKISQAKISHCALSAFCSAYPRPRVLSASRKSEAAPQSCNTGTLVWHWL